MRRIDFKQIEDRLLAILAEMEEQPEVAVHYEPGLIPYDSEMRQLREFIEVGGEYGIAYEAIVASLEHYPFRLSGITAVKLLELGLTFRFKTDREEDSAFDFTDENGE
jgi:hypothetical protein